ncbi:MAG: DUF3347 domain-containing protein [Flavobacterium sp.]
MKNTSIKVIAALLMASAISCKPSTDKPDEAANDAPAANAQAAPLKEQDSTVSEISTISDGAKQAQAENHGFSIAPIIADYLSLKNALVAGDDKAAAAAGKKLFATFGKVDVNTIGSDKQKQYREIADDAKEHAEHIGQNAGNIDHQREHLAALSEDLEDMVGLFGSPQTLYKDHCPMYNDGKGAIWLSENKAIKNPYYGSKMLGCGSVQETINSK